MTTYKELQEVFNIPKSVVVEAQLKTMPDDIVNLVLEFMPSYLKDIKIIKIVKEEVRGRERGRPENIYFYNSKRLWFHDRAKDGIGNAIYTFEFNHQKTIDRLNKKFDKPLYPLPIAPRTHIRSKSKGWNYVETPYVVQIMTFINWRGNCVLKTYYPEHDKSHRRPSTGKKICDTLQDYYSLVQLDLIVDFYKIKIPSKIRNGNKTKYIQYLMKQQF